MTQIEPDSAPSPFETEPKRANDGCARPVLAGCAVLGAVFAALLVFMVVRAQDLLAWSLEQLEEQIVTLLPEETTDRDRQRLSAALDGVQDSFADGSADPMAMRKLQEVLSRVGSRAESRLSEQDFDEILAALETVSGKASEP